MSENLTSPNNGAALPVGQSPGVPDVVSAALDDALVSVKRARTTKIGALLDSAALVLEQALSVPDVPPLLKLHAVEVVVDLYNAQENHVRQDAELKLSQQRLELERQKLLAPGGPLFQLQQNNLYVSTNAPQALSKEAEKQLLLQRKQAQDAVLDSYLAIRGARAPEISSPQGEEE